MTKGMLSQRRAVAVILLALSLTAATVPGGKPEDVGMSSERLQRVNDLVQTYIEMDSVSANRRESIGSFGWDGSFGTHFRVDRKEQLVGLLMVQESNGPLMRDFENAVMQTIIE